MSKAQGLEKGTRPVGDAVNYRQIIFFLAVSIVGSYALAAMSQNFQTSMHEDLHQLIFKVNGIDSNIVISQNQYFLAHGVTNPSTLSGLTGAQVMTIYQEQMLNEAVSYNTHWFLFFIVWALWFIAFMLFYAFIAWKR